jgi:SAM-dependent methyltransferase
VPGPLNRAQHGCRVYEQLGLGGLADEPIRPGGLMLTTRAVALAGWPSGARVLDLGCGAGAALRYLIGAAGLQACGIDPSGALLEQGRRGAPDLPLICGLGEDLPLAAASLDGILAECSLSLADVDRVLRECHRVLKAGAPILIHDVYARRLEGSGGLVNLPIRCCLAGAVSREEWLARLAAHGFKIRLWEDHSAALKEFAARLIFTYGSLEAFWCRAGDLPQQADARELKDAVIKSSPGYFLLLAQKV